MWIIRPVAELMATNILAHYTVRQYTSEHCRCGKLMSHPHNLMSTHIADYHDLLLSTYLDISLYILALQGCRNMKVSSLCLQATGECTVNPELLMICMPYLNITNLKSASPCIILQFK
jgi:hypothetical protein